MNNPRYVVCAARAKEGRQETLHCISGRVVEANKSTFTGLYDASGKEIYRVANRIGFHW